MAWIIFCITVNLFVKICYNCRDIEFFLRHCFYWRTLYVKGLTAFVDVFYFLTNKMHTFFKVMFWFDVKTKQQNRGIRVWKLNDYAKHVNVRDVMKTSFNCSYWQVYRQHDGEMLDSSVVPTASTFNFTAISDDGVIQLAVPKNYSKYGDYTIEYTGTASLEGRLLLLFCCQIFKWIVGYI